MNFIFTIPNKEAKKYQEWLDKHKNTCNQTEVGAIGGKYTFSFTHTSLGCIHQLKCVCGEKADFTDYENW